MKGIILCGGKGTRMMPCTKVTNKQLLPVYSNQGAVPMIYYPINTLTSSGVEDILIISSREHCGAIIETLGDGTDFGADFTYKIQDINNVQLGIASALKLAEGFTGRDNFAVILGDNFFEDCFVDQFVAFDKEKVEKDAAVFLKMVDDPHRFGVIEKIDDRIKIIEKPISPPSNLAVAGLYLYPAMVYDVARTLIPSDRGELEITDVNNWFAENTKLTMFDIGGYWSDMGVPESLVRTQEFIRRSGFKIEKFQFWN